MVDTSRTVRSNARAWWVLVALLAVLLALVPAPAGADESPAPAAASAPTDAFYDYDGDKPLADYAPGEVLKTRTLPYHVVGVPLPLKVVQIVFRSTNARNEPIAAVTSVIKPLYGNGTKVVSYQSFYDSLDPEHGPSRAIAGDVSLGGAIANVETGLIAPFLLQGFAVNVADTQGPTADFAAGPEYGQVTLDSIRAAIAAPGTGIAPTARVGLVGYSGGAIATNWASALAPTYAPDVNRRLVGAAEGGVLVRPSANLDYVSGSLVWAGVMPMAIIGVSRAYGIDLTPYLSDYGLTVHKKLAKASIAQALGAYPGLTWQQLTKPEYADPASVPEFVTAVNKLNLGSRPSPTIPMLIGQGAGGELEGTPGNKAGIGKGDGVMIAADVRTLARQYCADGVKVTHRQYPLSHITAAALWAPEAVTWLVARFGSSAAPSNCASIKPGNPLTPLASSN